MSVKKVHNKTRNIDLLNSCYKHIAKQHILLNALHADGLFIYNFHEAISNITDIENKLYVERKNFEQLVKETEK